jgi:hypothetical protein
MPRKRRPTPQPRIPGLVRLRLSLSVTPTHYARILADAARFGVSRAYVIATSSAVTLDCHDETPDYRRINRAPLRIVAGRRKRA